MKTNAHGHTLDRESPSRDRDPRSQAGSGPALTVEAVHHTIRHTTLRGIGFIGLLGITLIHLLGVLSKFHETPYLGAMYVGLMITSIVVALRDTPLRLEAHLDVERRLGRFDPARLRLEPNDRPAECHGRHRQLV